MLTITDPSSRREFLRIGAASVGGMGLAQWMAAKSHAAIGAAMRDCSVVVLNMQGGPTQFETFDPNMSAPREIRSITGATSTRLPGVTFGGTLPQVAALADRLAVVRSYRHGISSHGPAAMHVMAGGNPTGATMGVLFSRVAGLTNPVTGIPNNAVITSRAVGDNFGHLYLNTDRVSQVGTLPAAYKPFDPSAGGEIVENMKLRMSGDRLADRKTLLQQLDQARRQIDRDDTLSTASRIEQQAFDVLVRGVADAFDLGKEDPRVLATYDTSDLEPSDAIKKRNAYAKQFSPVALGRQMVLARRLCEAGCGFVTVTAPGWDMHGGGKEFTMQDGLASLMPAIDRVVAAFIKDVESRGLTRNILLVITGEFGRTPRINKNGGRDHWGNLCTLAFAGGALSMGQVVGQSDRTGSAPSSDPISSQEVRATIMHSLFDVGKLRLMTGIPKDVERVILAGRPIPGLIS